MRNKYAHILVLLIIAIILAAISFLIIYAPVISDTVTVPDSHQNKTAAAVQYWTAIFLYIGFYAIIKIAVNEKL